MVLLDVALKISCYDSKRARSVLFSWGTMKSSHFAGKGTSQLSMDLLVATEPFPRRFHVLLLNECLR